MNSKSFIHAALICAAYAVLSACSFNASRKPASHYEPENIEASPKPLKLTNPDKRIYPPSTNTDQAIDAKPHALPEIKPAKTALAMPNASTGEAAPSSGPWRIQVGSLPDLESAQARKRELDAKLPSPVEMAFDAPYYKLRWGGFASKQDAEDKLLELSDIFREGFVVRQ
jgi:cell division protein FtsN